MLSKKLPYLLIFLLLFCSCSILSKSPKNSAPSTPLPAKGLTTDTAAKKTTSKIKSFKEVITSKAITDSGLFTIHKIDDQYFFEIPDSLLKQDILIVNRIAKGSASKPSTKTMLGYAGDLIGENVIQFTKGPDNKIFIRRISFLERAKDSTENGLYRSFLNSNIQPIIASFDIKAFTPDSTGIVINVTDYINGDNDVLFFGSSYKGALATGSLQQDKSYIENIKSFPKNIEISTVKTYGVNEAAKTYALNSSIVQLPKNPMHPRSFDNRVGYFSAGYEDYDINPQGVENTVMITRWRLEPKAEDREKYKRGELVEPEKPIIFYIDPATPKKWIPYLIQGVNDWQKPFEKAGFKNAIYALEAPVNDPEWSLEDARHNAIVYKPSDIMNASGPHIHDPRTGEILETHVNWYHNVMQLLHDWYFIQASPNDAKARKMEFDDSLMGQLIHFVCAHEVGHTLGLLHNFGASSTVPVDSLRSKQWVEANGHTPSIMDYARFNYVAQPEDSISEKGIFPRIGVYDEWAIEWGYRWLPDFQTEKEEKNFLSKWIIKRTGEDKRLWFGSEFNANDPRCQSEDLGDNAMKAGYYGIQNLKRVMKHLLEWVNQPGEDYDQLKRMQAGVTGQYRRYLFHVVDNIGGILTTTKTMDQQGPVYLFVSKKTQEAAIDFLQKQLFTTPDWIFTKELFSRTGTGNIFSILELQGAVLKALLSPYRFVKFQLAEFDNPLEFYSLNDLLTNLSDGIWREIKNNSPINVYRRNLQKAYVEQLISVLEGDTKTLSSSFDDYVAYSVNKKTDVVSIVKGHIQDLINAITKALPGYHDKLIKLHLMDVRERLKEALKPKVEGQPSGK